jgi:hypothetical protein
MPQPEVLVFRAREKFDEQGKLIHDGTRDFLGAFLEKFYEWTLDVGTPVKSSEL